MQSLGVGEKIGYDELFKRASIWHELKVNYPKHVYSDSSGHTQHLVSAPICSFSNSFRPDEHYVLDAINTIEQTESTFTKLVNE